MTSSTSRRSRPTSSTARRSSSTSRRLSRASPTSSPCRSGARVVALGCFVDPRTPSVLRGDARLLRQVLVNLVGNAVKFTDSGEVAIRAELQPAEGNRVRVQFAVSDSGIGIPPDALEKLFEPFTQVDGSSTRAHGGTGLGLAISSRLVRLLGGELAVDSGVGRGSTFSFAVPFEVPERAADPAYGPLPQSRPLRVLIVEAAASAAETIDRYLRAWGMHTTRAASAAEGLKLFSAALVNEPYDAVLLAVSSAEASPDGLSSQLRELAGEDGVFVVALLDVGERLADRAAEPFDAVIAKPIKQSRLYDALAGCDRSAAPRHRSRRMSPPSRICADCGSSSPRTIRSTSRC